MIYSVHYVCYIFSPELPIMFSMPCSRSDVLDRTYSVYNWQLILYTCAMVLSHIVHLEGKPLYKHLTKRLQGTCID